MNNLLYRIEKRLYALAQLKEAEETLQTEQSTVQYINQQLINFEHMVTKQIIDLKKNCRQAAAYPDIQLPKTPIPDDARRWQKWINSYKQLPNKWKNLERQQQGKEQFVATLKRAVTITHENKRNYDELDALLKKLRRALEIITEKRHQFTDRVLNDIAAEVSRLYEEVHPRENLNSIKLQLESGKRASLEIGADFQVNYTPTSLFQ